jgi:hypothetical protein
VQRTVMNALAKEYQLATFAAFIRAYVALEGSTTKDWLYTAPNHLLLDLLADQTQWPQLIGSNVQRDGWTRKWAFQAASAAKTIERVRTAVWRRHPEVVQVTTHETLTWAELDAWAGAQKRWGYLT